MIPRYSLPAMSTIWEDKAKFDSWLQIEILSAEAWGELGRVPADAIAEIKQKAGYDVARVLEIEEEVKHDVIAFLTNVAERVGPSSRFLHLGLTSSDVLDTGLALQLRAASDLLIEETDNLIEAIKKRAVEHKDTVMIGRSHGVHAEPMTFGLKLLVWYHEMIRNRDRLIRARETVSAGKISGTVGTYANVEPFVEEFICEKLGLKPSAASSQILQRDRHAEWLTAIAITGSSLEKFATEVRALQKTEVAEAQEPFGKGQKGSSAMPHKRNPIVCERIAGMARLLRGNAMVGLENISLWHERDISHSSAERVILPDSSIILHYMLVKFRNVVAEMIVRPENMLRNLDLTGGLPFSGSVLLALVEKGVVREDAYRMVQRCAMDAWEEGKPFRELLKTDAEVAGYLSVNEVDECFDPKQPLRHNDEIFSRIERD